MKRNQPRFRKLAAAVLLAAIFTGAGATAAQASTDDPAVSEYQRYLGASSDPDAPATLAAFNKMTPSKKSQYVKILLDPVFIDESRTVESTESGTTQSNAFPNEVTYAAEASSPSTAPNTSNSSASTLSVAAGYPANSTQTGSWSQTAYLFGIRVTTLKVWVTFTTDGKGVPKSVISSGSSSRNLNFFVSVSATNSAPYLQTPQKLAVATTTWHGCAVFKGAGACFDKVMTAKWYAGGFYSGSIKNT